MKIHEILQQTELLRNTPEYKAGGMRKGQTLWNWCSDHFGRQFTDISPTGEAADCFYQDTHIGAFCAWLVENELAEW